MVIGGATKKGWSISGVAVGGVVKGVWPSRGVRCSIAVQKVSTTDETSKIFGAHSSKHPFSRSGWEVRVKIQTEASQYAFR